VEQARPRVDRFGDVLPDRAIARLGTRRFGHSFLTEKVLWSPDGKTLASLGGYSTGRRLCLWDAATGKELHDLPAQNEVDAAAFSPDGKVLAAMEERTGVVLWDVATGKRLHDFTDKIYGQALAFAPDGKTLAASGEDHVIRIWDVATASATAELTGHTDRLWDLAYAPDGKTLASTSHDKTLRLWDVAAGREVWQRSPFGDGIGAVRFSRDGKTLAAVGNDATVRILDAATGKELRSFGGGLKHWGFALDYSPDGRTLATAGPDGCIRLWDPTTGKEIRRWGAGMLQVHSVAFSPDGRSLASSGACGTTIRLWDPATGKEIRPTPGHHAPVTALTFVPDGKILWSWGRDKALLRWDVATGQYQSLFGGPMNGALDWTAFTADGRALATGGRVDHRVRLWGTDGTERATLGTHDGRVLGVAFSPDGKLLVSGGDDGQIRLWDVEARKEVRRLEAPADRWGQFVFSPDGRRLAAASVAAGQEAHNSPRVFDVATGKEVVKLDEPLTEATLAFSPDGRTLAVAGGYRDQTVRLADATTGKIRGRCEGHTKGVWSLAFSPDGRYLATGGYERDDLVRLWEVATCQEVARFTGHHSGVGALAFTPDARALASGAGDATILLWDLTGRAPDGRLRPERLSPAGLGQCWDNLRGEDAAAAYRAVWGLADDPARSVPFLRERLRPVPAAEPAVLARHLADLDANEFEVRQRAETELKRLGDAAESALRKLADDGAPAPHVRKRADGILDALATSPDRLRSRRAVAALEYAATPEARQLLQTLANGMPGAWLTAEARASLSRLGAPAAGRR
jgi:WD40 repeat protein